jgi:hypothetical protein
VPKQKIPTPPIEDFKTDSPTPEPPKQNEFYIPRNYARSNVQPLWATNTLNSNSRKYTNEQIAKLLLNPYLVYKELQQVSNYLLYTSSLYNNFLDYLSGVLAFDYVITCDDSETVTKSKLKSRYYESSKVVHKINVKSIFPSMLKRVLANGECYFYNISDAEGAIIVEIDSRLCQLYGIDEDNIWRYFVNLSFIDTSVLYELPDEIQKAYQKWIDGGKSKAKKKINDIEIPDYLYPVSNKGFAIFSHMRKTQHDYPYLCHMFQDLNSLESDKTYMSEYIKDNNIKLIHLKVPVDKESGVPLMDKDIIQSYHASAKEHMPKNVAPLTNPFDVEALSLDKSQSTAINLVEHSNKVVMQDSGISENIFNSSSTLGLEYSTLSDGTKLFPFLYFFENFINLIIKEKKCKVKFLQITQYNRLEWHERYYSDVQAGGSRSLFAVTGGIEPYDVLNLANTEKAIGIDDLLEPKLNSSQMNSEDLTKKNGSPKKDAKDASDSTNKVNEYK